MFLGTFWINILLGKRVIRLPPQSKRCPANTKIEQAAWNVVLLLDSGAPDTKPRTDFNIFVKKIKCEITARRPVNERESLQQPSRES